MDQLVYTSERGQSTGNDRLARDRCASARRSGAPVRHVQSTMAGRVTYQCGQDRVRGLSRERLELQRER